MSQPAQSFANHAKMVPLYHFWTTLFLVAPTFYFAWEAVTDFSWDAVMIAVFAIGVVLAAFFARAFPLGVQDRVIRLEERIRMQSLPEDLRARIDDIPTDLVIGLRFASDDELEGLVRRVLDGELSDRKSVKAAVRSWRADHQRI